MMNLRDRLPGTSGNRSFSKKMILISVTVLVGLGILFWYANQLVVSINPEDGLPKQCFTAKMRRRMEYCIYPFGPADNGGRIF